MKTENDSPFAIKNIRLFIAFRIFFNARFYYPVFTIIFLDFGLTIEQFAILNSVWAVTIVLTEVPSGALADILGRKKLLVTTSFLMIFEMGLLCFVPLGNMQLVFWVFLINRVLSGLAEAMASGADEAIAYDSLQAESDKSYWPKVLSLQMRFSAVASVITGTVGAIIYDPETVNTVLQFFGSTRELNQQQTMRFPLYLTFLLSIFAAFTAWSMKDPAVSETETSETEKYSVVGAFKKTVQAGTWITKTPFALAIILFGMTFDHVLRMMVTMTSQYFRLIDIPEALFGVIGAGISLIGLVVPKIAEKMAQHYTPARNVFIISSISVIGFTGLYFFIPYFGVLPMALIFVAIMFTSFFTSHYLNRITSSHQRATVLSFKGLAFNLAYGSIGILFASLMQRLRTHAETAGVSAKMIDDLAFKQAVGWFPWYTLIIIVFTALLCRYILRNSTDHTTINSSHQE